MSTALVPREVPDEMSVEQIVAQTMKIQQCMEKVMKVDQHYGVIPGTGTADRPGKPTLLKPGAEKLCLLFRLDPEYDVIATVETPERISYMVRCTLYHIPTTSRVASGLGSCNSREEKYLRAAPKKCPACSKETIFITKMENEPKYYCWKKKGGCGAKFKDGDQAIDGQSDGIKDPADLANTLLKLACKRALVAAVLNGTAASDFFTQDLEDLTEKAAEYIPPKEGSAPKGAAPGAGNTPATSVGAPTTKETTATGGKPPRANTVKHDGTMASHKQVAYLHMQRSKVGGLDVCDEKHPCYDGQGKRINPVRGMCLYHKQLAAFKDCDGRPIRSSVDLSEAQISNLIDRYEAKIEEQAKRAEEVPDLEAAFGQAEENAKIRGELGPGADG